MNELKAEEKRQTIIGLAIILGLMATAILAIVGLVSYQEYDRNQRETQKATGNFSGYVSEIEPIFQDGTTVSVSVKFKVDGTDPEIVVLGPEFASLTQYTTLDLTGCQKNPAGFWENCQVNIR